MSQELLLPGCRTSPLADYLKGLGVFRIVAEQRDPAVRARWSQHVMVLQGSLDREALLDFFTTIYLPTPLVAPWNGGSGFYSEESAITLIERSDSPRLAAYRDAIRVCRETIGRFGLSDAPIGEEKRAFIESVRAAVSDEVVRWIDAVIALEQDGMSCPPLLGTGGNDGNLEFSNNHMQRLAEVLNDSTRSRTLLRAALFDEHASNLSKAAIGQFRPGAAGGPNSNEGFKGDSLVNPWDFVLALEGTLVFAVAISRRLESSAGPFASFPFTVRATSAGYGSASRADEAKGSEIWLPIWSRAASYAEVAGLFGEGRARIARRTATNGVDFARAITSLGTDRGIESFTRVGFSVRNGKSSFAVPLEEWDVEPRRNAALLTEIDDWLIRLSRAANTKTAPASLRRAASHIDTAILQVCRQDDAASVADLLVALGEVEVVCARSPAARGALRPIASLSSAWAEAADDGTSEFRLAAALSAGGIREYLSPARRGPKIAAWGIENENCVWADRPLIDNMIAVARRREVTSSPPYLDGSIPATACDVVSFIEGETDDGRLDALTWGLCMVSLEPAPGERSAQERALPALFSIARLALTRRPASGVSLPQTPGLLSRLASGDAVAATRMAERRLRGAGLVPRCGPLAATRDLSRRTSAALLFPLSASTLAAMRRQIVRTSSLENL